MENIAINQTNTTEEKYGKIFRSSPIAIVITRLSDGKIIEVNEAGLKLFSYSADDLKNQTTINLSVWADPKARDLVVQEIKSKGFVRNKEVVFLDKNKKEISVEYSAEIIEINNDKCAMSIFFDITERKRTEKSLKETQEILAKRLTELEKTNKLMVGRELKMAELKKRIKELETVKTV